MLWEIFNEKLGQGLWGGREGRGAERVRPEVVTGKSAWSNWKVQEAEKGMIRSRRQRDYLLIQQIFIKHLLCARHILKCQGYRDK